MILIIACVVGCIALVGLFTVQVWRATRQTESEQYYRMLRFEAADAKEQARRTKQAIEAAKPGNFHETVRRRPLPKDACITCSSGGMIISEENGTVSWDVCPDCAGTGKKGK